jgi:FdhD protein
LGIDRFSGGWTLPRPVEVTQVTEWTEAASRDFLDCLAAEEPLEIRLNKRPLSVTMRTPGADLELAAGFLLTEGLLSDRSQILSLRHAGDNRVNVQVSGHPGTRRLRRNFFAASSCGLCGKASLDSLRLAGLRAPENTLRLDPALLAALPDRLRAHQTIFGRTGGLHAAALFDSAGQLVVLREDIGRHNAVDKVIGWAVLAGRLPLARHMLLVSGRGGFEIVQKSLAAGLEALLCVSAPSSLAVRLAREFSLTLVGFLRGSRFVLYSGGQRLPAATSSSLEAGR